MPASTVSSYTTRQAVEGGRLDLSIDKCLQEKNVSGTCANYFSLTCSVSGALGALFRPSCSLIIIRTLALIRVSITRSLIHSRGMAWLGYLDGRRSVCTVLNGWTDVFLLVDLVANDIPCTIGKFCMNGNGALSWLFFVLCYLYHFDPTS